MLDTTIFNQSKLLKSNNSSVSSRAEEFKIFPAIDLLDGQSVRLQKGQRDSAQVVHPDPLEQLATYAASGASWVHIVDLNAAFGDNPESAGRQTNHAVLKNLVALNQLKIQVGGGVKNVTDFYRWLELGVQRVVVGTWCANHPSDVLKLAQQHPENLIAGLDSLSGKVTVNGWTQISTYSTADFAKLLYEGGMRYGLFTEVEKDGMLGGIDANKAGDLAATTGLKIIASGGVRDILDIENLANTAGVCGVIVGKALAAKTLKLADTLKFER